MPMLAVVCACFLVVAEAGAAVVPPRLIVSIIVDDLGSADLGYTGSGIATPHLDRLRAEGVALTSIYVQPVCTPSRSSFFTGRYPLAFGLQGKDTVQQGCSWGLDMEEQTFVEAFRASGWATHMVGKAHIGGDYWRRTPTWRGFESFVGYLYGAEDYNTHILGEGYDLRNDSGVHCGPGCSRNIGPALNGTYSTYIFGGEVVRLVAKAGAAGSQPTYLHFTPQSVHSPNEAPESFVAPYKPVFGPNNTVRAIHAGAIACLDEAIGNITAAIAAAGLADETLILLIADNGGPMGAVGDGTMASNYPLRGGKHSLFEGGVRAASFAWGPSWLGVGVNRSWAGLAHISDIGLSLLDAAGLAPLPPKPGKPVHGSSFWKAVTGATPSSREDVVINIDYTTPSQAAIVGKDGWKLILGVPGVPSSTYWSDRVGERDDPPSDGAHALPALQLRDGDAGALWPLSNMTAQLFNLNDDPREIHNVASAHADIVALLVSRLAVWGVGAVPVVENATSDPRANPKHWNGSWTPWLGI